MKTCLLCALGGLCLLTLACREEAGDDPGPGFCEQALHLEFSDMGYEGGADFAPDEIACTRLEAVHVGDETHVEILFDGSTAGMEYFDLEFELFYLEAVEAPEEFDGEVHDGLISAGDFDGEIRGALVYQMSAGVISGEFDGELYHNGDPVYVCFEDVTVAD